MKKRLTCGEQSLLINIANTPNEITIAHLQMNAVGQFVTRTSNILFLTRKPYQPQASPN